MSTAVKTSLNFNFLILSALALAASSCANNVGGGPGQNTSTSDAIDNYVNPFKSGTISESGYTCSSAANVLPNANSDAIFTDRWTVCVNASSAADIEIQGQASESQVCIFPASVVNSSSVITFAFNSSSTSGSLSALPWYQCVSPSSNNGGSGSGAYAAFPGITYDAMFVVEFSDVLAMQACLYSGTYYNCPAYSYGKFR